MAFSGKRAAKHAALAFVLVIVAGGIVTAAADVADPEKFGEGTGKFSVFAAALAFGVSWMFQTGRKVGAWSVIIGFVGLVAAVVVLIVSAPPYKRALDLARHRGPLVRDGAQLRHPTLGFTVASPGAGYEENADAARMMGTGKDVQTYAYMDGDRDVFIVEILAQPLDSCAAVTGFLDGANTAMGHKVADALATQLSIVDRRTIGSGTHCDATEHLAISDLHVRFHVYPRPTYAVLVASMSRDEHALEAAVDSLR
jgi:hypothetical protein